jgi:hypothetical protein
MTLKHKKYEYEHGGYILEVDRRVEHFQKKTYARFLFPPFITLCRYLSQPLVFISSGIADLTKLAHPPNT